MNPVRIERLPNGNIKVIIPIVFRQTATEQFHRIILLIRDLQEALHALEYALGPADSEFGAIRAAMANGLSWAMNRVPVRNRNRKLSMTSI